MNQVLDVIHRLHTLGLHMLGIDPLLAVIIVALLCALVEQRWRRRRTPDFSSFRYVESGPDKPPAPAAKSRA